MDKNNDVIRLLKDTPEYEDYSENYLREEATNKCPCREGNKGCGCSCGKSSKSECNHDKYCYNKKQKYKMSKNKKKSF